MTPSERGRLLDYLERKLVGGLADLDKSLADFMSALNRYHEVLDAGTETRGLRPHPLRPSRTWQYFHKYKRQQHVDPYWWSVVAGNAELVAAYASAIQAVVSAADHSTRLPAQRGGGVG